MPKIKGKFLIVAVMMVFMASCTTYHPHSGSTGSGANITLAKGEYTVLGVGTGTSCADFIIGIPTSGENTFQQAVNKAVASKQGDLLVQSSADVKLNYFPTTFFSLWNQSCVTVQGMVIKLN
ncbi:DUF6567 family protein [Nitrospina watsonii]|uniref:Lipoprotein n=1 Tax=Nitrospina watsonii TaxID=1323948 RepID=A0ABM9H9Y9_9BACT|nr:hypothetical protein [Nitrospina watsonii]CAI2716940.1 conserved exported protein of unknown function [Nitrospina watsonii]